MHRFLQAYEKHNLTMWGLTVENEPNAGYVPEYKWNCLGFNASLERDFVKLDLGPMLHDNGYTNDKLKLMIYDDQLPNLVNFNDIVLSDVDAAKYVSGVAFHWYHSDEQNRYNIDKIVKHYPQYFVLSTEACDIWEGEKHVLLGNWDTFDRYANDIIKVYLTSILCNSNIRCCFFALYRILIIMSPDGLIGTLHLTLRVAPIGLRIMLMHQSSSIVLARNITNSLRFMHWDILANFWFQDQFE